jgi:DNA-binding response OmpR family regulator
MTGKQILIVEDEKPIRDMIAFGLRRAGFSVREAEDCSEARSCIADSRPDLLLVDWMLPDQSGLELTRFLKRNKETQDLPVIMLTARAEEHDKVAGLEGGADDYVTKPFSAAELVARLRAVLRRTEAAPPTVQQHLEVGDVLVDLDRRQVTRGGEAIDLTVKEFDLLRLLVENAGRLVKRETLMSEVWDPNWWGSTKTLDVHVSALRKKLGDDPASPRYIHTIRGVGFRFASADELGA